IRGLASLSYPANEGRGGGGQQGRQTDVQVLNAERQVAVDGVRRCERARDTTCCTDAPQGVIDRPEHLRVVHLAWIAHRLRQVPRRDEEDVNVLNAQDV